MSFSKLFSIRKRDSIISPEDLGSVNEKIALNGWFNDIAEIRGVYAPPYFSDDFKLKIRFNGFTADASDYTWEPDRMIRTGRKGVWRFTSTLAPAANCRGAVMKIEAVNTSAKSQTLDIQYEIVGGLGEHFHWEFGKPIRAPFSVQNFDGKIFSLEHDGAKIAVGSSCELSARKPWCSGVIDTPQMTIPAKGKAVFYTVLTVGKADEAAALAEKLLADPAKELEKAHRHWEKRVEKLFQKMPEFSCDNKDYEKLYNRSLMHLLMNEWDIPEFLLHPYYSTGSINGGCVCCYLWNYGEPYHLWSMLDPASAREHLKVYLRLDLTGCFAFHPEDGSAYGPYYPINQEKVIFLTAAYVLQTKDTAFLHEEVDGKSIIQHMIDQALMHDDLSKEAILVDFGSGNHHLELRRELRYDGIVPDLNLRRCVNYQLVNNLCKLANVTPPVDMVKRADAIRDLVKKELYSEKDGWFFAKDANGKYLRWTMQMFKVLGWKGWTMGEEEETALISHLMNEDEFLGEFGIHSLAKIDPAYDERDIDNGGPGACPSFAPTIAERLYHSGNAAAGGEIMRRLRWLGKNLPYCGDSHRADVREYRRDTPLQCDIQGTGPAQAVIFGTFGIAIETDFSISITPHLLPGAENMALKNIRLAGKVFDVECDEKMVKVTCGKEVFIAENGKSVTLV